MCEERRLRGRYWNIDKLTGAKGSWSQVSLIGGRSLRDGKRLEEVGNVNKELKGGEAPKSFSIKADVGLLAKVLMKFNYPRT